MPLLFRKPGVLTTVQDLGRFGGRSLGINPNGVMDTTAARLINIILGNAEPAAVVECHFPGPVIEFEVDTMFAIGGGDLGARIDDHEIPNWSSQFAAAGSVLKFAEKRSGNRAYITVKGGFKIDDWLGSSSTNLAAHVGGFAGRRLIAGDQIACSMAILDSDAITIGPSLIPRYSRFPTIRIVSGGEFDLLTSMGEQTFLNDGFTLTTDCDRMGYRLSGKPIHVLHPLEMISSAVTFGTIQLLPDGQVIILMADHQTSGGYPRIGNIISVDLPLLAQCGPGDGVSFELVSIEEAERLAVEFENELNFLRVGCRLRNQNAVN